MPYIQYLCILCNSSLRLAYNINIHIQIQAQQFMHKLIIAIPSNLSSVDPLLTRPTKTLTGVVLGLEA